MPHIARAHDFDALKAALDERAERRLVARRTHPEAEHLVLYCYTQQATFSGEWDSFVEAARGLVLDTRARRVVATPFPKFFNYGERGRFDLPDEPFEVFEKLDGSLAIVFHDSETWRVATKGSFISEQAKWATAWLADRAFAGLSPACTYLFEIIYPENQIVVRYDFSGLVMLGAYDPDGEEIETDDLWVIARALGTRVATSYHYDSIEEIVDAVAKFGSDREGFVVRFMSGYRVKVKGAEYLRVHRLASRITPLGLWDAMQSGDDLDGIRKEIPEEFYGDFDTIRTMFQSKFDALGNAVATEAAKWEGKPDKELGLALDTIDESIRRLVFPFRKKGAAWATDPVTRKLLFKQFRPDGNLLDGYKPGGSLARIAEDA